MLTIIIPIYNVEETLRQCVESVMSQSFTDWEMLLIDDGSPDGSGNIADQLAASDPRIHSFHKPNGGLSDARNYGLERSRGEYITFIDSDDTLAPGTLLPIMQLMQREGSDITEYSVLVHAGNSDEHRLTLPDHTWTSARQYWTSTEAWEHCYAWNKIYRRDTLRDITFPKGRIFEDVWFYPQLLQRNPRITTTSLGLYIYQWNTRGITVTAGRRSTIHLLTSQIRAALLMHTTPFNAVGRKLYRSMACRLYDIIRLSLPSHQ